MKIKRYEQFVNENLKGISDIDILMNYIYNNVPSDQISELKNKLSELSYVANEGLFSDVKNKLIKWFDAKMMNYFVDKKKSFYTNLIGKLNKFDLTNLDDVYEAYPNFTELTSIYLAGGMDKAADVGAGWRNVVEYIFEIENPSKKSNLEKVKIDYKGETYSVIPSYIIDDYHLSEAIEKGKSYIKKYYSAPAIFNPVRKEVDRTKNPEFARQMGLFKSGKYKESEEMMNKTFDEISKTFSSTIEPEDEKIVILADAIFYGANEYASAGTFGELQQTSFLTKPMFVWYEGKSPIEANSPWTIPHVTKIMRSEDDVRLFVKTMINSSKK